jgi:asparagine synthase (glutamine-hydrolysing)
MRAIGANASLINVEDLLKSVVTPKGIDPLSEVLARDLAIVLCSDMLTKVDRTSMEHGLEVRSPFLDHRIVETAFAIHGNAKIKLDKGKHILREAFRNDLPPVIFKRPKRGFEIPLARWLRTDFAEWTNVALEQSFLESLGINPQMGRYWKKQLDEGHHQTVEIIWTLLSIYKWTSTRA